VYVGICGIINCVAEYSATVSPLVYVFSECEDLPLSLILLFLQWTTEDDNDKDLNTCKAYHRHRTLLQLVILESLAQLCFAPFRRRYRRSLGHACRDSMYAAFFFFLNHGKCEQALGSRSPTMPVTDLTK